MTACGFARLALLQRLTDAKYRCETGAMRRQELGRNHLAGLAYQRATLRVADNHVLAPDSRKHTAAALAGISA